MTNFRDIVRKIMPESKRGNTWLDWNYTASSPISELNSRFEKFLRDTDYIQKYSIQYKAFVEMINELYDPYYRNIYIDKIGASEYNIVVPTYLVHGNWNTVISKTVDRFNMLGVKYDFDTYNPGITHEASVYLTELASNLSGTETLTDSEIWAVQNLYNKLKGSGLLSSFVKLHLISKSNKTNALIDFINPSTGEMDEVGNLTHNSLGLSSPGSGNYIETNFTPSTDISDPDNWCTVLHISKEGSFANEYILGSRNGSTASYVRMDKLSKELITAKGNTSNLINTPNSTSKGAYMFYIDSGEQNIIKNGSVIATNTAVSSAALSTNEEFLLDFNDSGSPFGSTSSDTVSTYAQIDSALDAIDRVYINKVLTEYNDRLKR